MGEIIWDNKQDSVLTGCCFTALYMLLSGKRKDVLFMANCLGVLRPKSCIVDSCRVWNVISILCNVIILSVICKQCIGGASCSCGTGVVYCGTGGCIVVLGFLRAE